MLLFHGMMLIVAKHGHILSKIAKNQTHRDLGALCVGITMGLLVNQSLSNGINNRVTPGWCFWAIGAAVLITKREIEEDDDLNTPTEHPKTRPVVFPMNKTTYPQSKPVYLTQSPEGSRNNSGYKLLSASFLLKFVSLLDNCPLFPQSLNQDNQESFIHRRKDRSSESCMTEVQMFNDGI